MSKYVPWVSGGGGQEFQLIGSGPFRGSRNKETETFLLEKREMGRPPLLCLLHALSPHCQDPPALRSPGERVCICVGSPAPSSRRPAWLCGEAGSWSCTSTDTLGLPWPGAGLYLQCSMERGRNEPLKGLFVRGRKGRSSLKLSTCVNWMESVG